MKKLLLIAATSAAIVAGSANAATSSTAIKPYVNAFVGYTTADAFSNSSDSSINQITIIRKHHHPFSLGLAAGTDLVQLSSNLSLGAELSFDYALTQPEMSIAQQSTTQADIKVQHYAINPMAYAAYSPMQQLTIKAKAGFGYQHYGYKFSLPTINDGKNYSSSTGAWKPVLAAEVAYNINDRFAVIAGDQYTFGDNVDKTHWWQLVQKIQNADNSWEGFSVPSNNMIYVGGQVKF